MQVKRFFAADMRIAMKMIRDELGADAVITGNRRVAGGVELTAVLDYPMESAAAKQPNPALEAELRKTQARLASAHAEMSAPSRGSVGQDRQLLDEKPAAAAQAAPVAASSSFETRAVEAMQSELQGLRELIEVQLGSIAWGQEQSRRPQQAGLWRRLQRIGLPAELSRALLEKVSTVSEPRQAWRMLLAYLAQSIKVSKIEPLEEGGVIALVGPAGAGKTTTLAKLAARYVLKHGPQSIALASMDNYRIGAQEQLKTLGRILDVPVIQLDPNQPLSKTLAPLARKRLILIDTAGLPAGDSMMKVQLEALADRGIKAKNYLVLPATSQSQVLKATWHNYRRCGLAGCILTKLDEAGSLGDVLGLIISQHLPIAYLADGPRIPDDLHLPRSHQLVSRAVSLQSEEAPSEETMADMFSDLYNGSRKVG
ncbi:flagellar biosynthesis protein FlhF [Pseudomonas sp. Choline-3u-10]|jgi:flagellar biosynthesis protein FlhF|uniref:flagellar biosynthesis protein FlhF n=1 Tax=Pseudomonadaceae TaxID=135621 RepID=UPI000C33133D|nr:MULTISPECIES: flagellar biosynthesis protein FlhF [Pseudomonadaceae]MAL35460.1 flagellar biosynthesis protein FlhF [Pseudomonas sp.]MBU0951085.1 flagellar biosynthesis protein FlhF [Gammaproteobacteria bacterium]MBK3794979.1 flagellar biosynthesis protein FlhF [Stutzerimonas stutzeri]MBK3878668.1 flagellar biosynthesis protein FlhF [Stutzerimonas stutzeri]PKG93812.1 flagellar biosynthesis protein FlhF [Pseudomonas sp. Choline-3u-10]